MEDFLWRIFLLLFRLTPPSIVFQLICCVIFWWSLRSPFSLYTYILHIYGMVRCTYKNMQTCHARHTSVFHSLHTFSLLHSCRFPQGNLLQIFRHWTLHSLFYSHFAWLDSAWSAQHTIIWSKMVGMHRTLHVVIMVFALRCHALSTRLR